jgi:hypothetical protein
MRATYPTHLIINLFDDLYNNNNNYIIFLELQSQFRQRFRNLDIENKITEDQKYVS